MVEQPIDLCLCSSSGSLKSVGTTVVFCNSMIFKSAQIIIIIITAFV